MNHNGNFGLLETLVREAKYSGADYVKFQLGWRENKGEINYWSDEDILRLEKICNFYDAPLVFSIINRSALERLKVLNLDMPFVKIASRTVAQDMTLVRDIANNFDEVIASLGFVDNVIPDDVPSNVKFLRCLSKYPSDPWDYSDILTRYDEKVIGYSCHFPGIEVALAAVSHGAKLVEKHFTLDKSDTSIRDHALSATPDEFRLLTRFSDKISRML